MSYSLGVFPCVGIGRFSAGQGLIRNSGWSYCFVDIPQARCLTNHLHLPVKACKLPKQTWSKISESINSSINELLYLCRENDNLKDIN